MRLDAVLSGSCKEIQTELVIPQSDLTWLESGANQHGPEIAFVVIHFVIVNLYFRTESQPECGQLEESLPLHVGTFTNSNPEPLSKRHADWMTNCGSARCSNTEMSMTTSTLSLSRFGSVCSIVP